MRILSIVSFVLACGLAGQAQGATTLSVSGSTNATVVSSGFSFTLQGTGTLSGFGSAVFVNTGSVANVNALNIASTITGTFSLIFPTEGDVLSGSFVVPAGLLIPSLGQNANATATLTVTGGTGRFAGASGSFPSFSVTGRATGGGSATFQGSGSGTVITPTYHVVGTIVYSGLLAHLASGNGWKTIIVLLNNGTVSAQAKLNFFDDHGAALTLPLSFPQGMPATTGNTFTTTMLPGAELILESQGPDATLSTGSAQLSSDGAVTGFLIFRYVPSGQEASVPLQTGTAGAYVLPFDTTTGLTTGLAVANVTSASAPISVVVHDDAGAILASDIITLNAQGHLSFVITDRYPSVLQKRGTIVFHTPAGGQIGAIAIRATASGAYTTIPPSTE
jgi:hypothetical protein